MNEGRSGCPIGLTLDVVGDRWTLLILRDIIIRGLQRYNEFLESREGISTNILADRLRRLEDKGIIIKTPDAENGKSSVYSPTKKGLDLLPILIEMMKWGSTHDKCTDQSNPFLKRLKADERQLKADVLANFSSKRISRKGKTS